MTTWFVTRHAGAAAWAARHGIAVDRLVDHLDTARIRAGDTVAGTLPVHLAAAVCARGARYLHLSLDVPAHLRGRDLDADAMEAAGARLEGYVIMRKAAQFPPICGSV